ncbi:kelch-like protein 8 [Littorina saxatilis]|uniref:BTB domain-containing protein n=1 Tax=Littorina saxatilis TaxID=31220 RepID=A0AAN9G714_9CAEN
MPQVPPPPSRTDSLPNSASPVPNSTPTPPVPALPSQAARRGINSTRKSRPRSGHFSAYSPSSRRGAPASQKMSAAAEAVSGQNADNPAVQNFEAKTHWKDSFKVLHQLYESQEMCDVEICVGKKSFKCHRVVLACASLYFRAMFKSEMAESRQDVVTIQDLDEDAMGMLVEFAYTARVKITTETVQPLLFAASILQIECVAEACANFMKSHLHPSNCIEVHNFAELHNRQELMRMTDEYILDHFTEVTETEEFLKISVTMLTKYASSELLNVDEETQVYEAIMQWIKHDLDQRHKHLSQLIAAVRLPLLSMTYLMETVEKEELVRKNLECRDFLDEAKYFQMSQVSLVPDVSISVRTRPRKSYAGVLFCVGGRGATGDPFKTVECYDPRKNRWFQVAEMNVRRRHVGVCSANGMLYAVGGHDGNEHLNSGEVFNPKTNKWKSIAPMGTLRRGLALASLGGPIYAVGGLDDTTCFNTVERYDPGNDGWTFVASMLTPRGGVGLTALKGHLYAIGGNDGVSSLDKCERYDPFLNKWGPVTCMHKRRAGSGCAVLDGYIYVVGGFDDSSPLDSVERFDPKTNEWTLVGNMTTCRGGVGLGSLGRRLYAVGGHDSFNYLNSVEAYEPDSNSWESVKHIQQFRAGAGVAFCSCLPRFLRQHSTRNTAEHLQCV